MTLCGACHTDVDHPPKPRRPAEPCIWCRTPQTTWVKRLAARNQHRAFTELLREAWVRSFLTQPRPGWEN